ncbi:MAG: glycerol-3-phosphate 1-O-acyltransferase PlsY [Candidatus Krumholzibacteriota bacterium]|nr:glycerol-3-phosphate 1-O-acyltransferase PlsY [Candidatus Krumholzibacteriota bacterium]
MNQALKILLVIVTSYILGSIPSSYIMGRLTRGIDLRSHGSGNLGAANTFRVLGARAAVPVLLIDIGKGFFAVKLASFLGTEHFAYSLIAVLAVIIGHNFSVFVNFSGGKGVGTTTGAFLCLAPLAVGICFIIWLVILIVSRIVSIASIISISMLPVIIITINRFGGGKTHASIIYLSIFTALMVIYKHRSNIRRMIDGKEGKLF